MFINLEGEQGCGKSQFSEHLGKAVLENYFTTGDIDMLGDQFGAAILEDKFLINFDELVKNDVPIEKIKQITTAEKVINRKMMTEKYINHYIRASFMSTCNKPIYDVINDWLHSEDILSAFLRIYQIVEFLIYRQQMSEIIKVSTIKQSFLREVKNLNKRFETGERATIVENIPIVFGSLTAATANINSAEPFIKKYFGKNKKGTHAYLFSTLNANEKSKGIARFIYDIRCSIVHNKEAEFHISYNNYEEYKEVLPLLKEVHDQLANKIWTLMNTPGSCISYENERYIDLF